MRIALVANYPLAPANSGAPIRSQHLARALARRGTVVAYCKAPPGFLDAYAGHPDLAAFAAVRILSFDERALREPNPQFATAFELDAAPEHPLWVQLARDHAARPFDVVVAEQIFLAAVRRVVPGVPVVLDEHNIESRVLEHIADPLGRPEYPVSVAQARAYEAEVWGQVDLVTCVSEADAAVVRAARRGATEAIPNGVTLADVRLSLPSQRQGADVLFIGSFFWSPNAEAACFLAREVMPRVWAAFPSARLLLCGMEPNDDVRCLARPGVVVTGTVPSVRPYLKRAAVYANALQKGEGASLKTLEPLAAGLPLVSTEKGVRGYPLEPDVHYLPARDADSFARAICRVLADPGSHDAMAQRGRAVAERFDWTVIGERFADLVIATARARSEWRPSHAVQ